MAPAKRKRGEVDSLATEDAQPRHRTSVDRMHVAGPNGSARGNGAEHARPTTQSDQSRNITGAVADCPFSVVVRAAKAAGAAPDSSNYNKHYSVQPQELWNTMPSYKSTFG